ncbi:MAG: type II toxin-antitoxin system RelE/ParE family toxin [Trueperaceae bacterium]|nr:type II toxin-antitoxin system RelE/ParE family toxin [Trueperaceae bacterium]
MLTRLNRIETDNHFGDIEPVSDGVFELRFHFGPGYRIYYGKDGDKVIILLCGGIKKSQKRDIAKAKEYWEDYLSNQ